jgi:predicted SAM-dependent methyltransferase
MNKAIIKLAKGILHKFDIDVISTKINDDTAHYIQLFGKENVKGKSFYNISAGGHNGFGGGFSHPCWRNIDFLRSDMRKVTMNPEFDTNHDLESMEPIPVESDTAQLIQSQYTIEHITDNATEVFFKEAHRMLKPKGVFRIVMPNNQLDYIAYHNNDKHYFNWINMFSKPEYYRYMQYKIPLNQASLEQIFLIHFASNASVIHADGSDKRISDKEFVEIIKGNSFENAMNMCTCKCSVEKQRLYRQNHINWWTHDKARSFLKKAGFKNIYQLSVNQSISPVMRNKDYFDRYWNNVAIFMEAVK